jgi:hypothetical protein
VGAEGCVWFGLVGAPPAASPFFHPLRVGTPWKRVGFSFMSFMVSIVFNRFKRVASLKIIRKLVLKFQENLFYNFLI